MGRGGGKAASGAGDARFAMLWRGLAAVVFGILLAKWGWALFAPRPAAVAVDAGREASVEAGRLFGVAAPMGAANQGVALPNVRLLGVFTGAHGFAILSFDGKGQRGFAPGEEVAPGTRLVEVGADHVVLARAGVRQRVELEGLASALASAKAAQASAAGLGGI